MKKKPLQKWDGGGGGLGTTPSLQKWSDGPQKPLSNLKSSKSLFVIRGYFFVGEVVVNVKENGARYRRSADGVSVPAKNMDIIFTLNESNIDLHLQRRDEITSNVPIFTMDGEGSVIKEFIQNKNVSFRRRF